MAAADTVEFVLKATNQASPVLATVTKDLRALKTPVDETAASFAGFGKVSKALLQEGLAPVTGAIPGLSSALTGIASAGNPASAVLVGVTAAIGGLVATIGPAAEKSIGFQTAMEKLTKSTGTLAGSIGEAFLPAVQAVVEQLGNLAAGLVDFDKRTGIITGTVQAVATALQVLGKAAEIVATPFVVAAAAIEDFQKALGYVPPAAAPVVKSLEEIKTETGATGLMAENLALILQGKGVPALNQMALAAEQSSKALSTIGGAVAGALPAVERLGAGFADVAAALKKAEVGVTTIKAIDALKVAFDTGKISAEQFERTTNALLDQLDRFERDGIPQKVAAVATAEAMVTEQAGPMAAATTAAARAASAAVPAVKSLALAYLEEARAANQAAAATASAAASAGGGGPDLSGLSPRQLAEYSFRLGQDARNGSGAPADNPFDLQDYERSGSGDGGMGGEGAKNDPSGAGRPAQEYRFRSPWGASDDPGAQLQAIPRFDMGGVVPGPAGRPQLAVVHGGEEITPPGQRRGGGGGSAGGPTVINIHPGAVVVSGTLIRQDREWATLVEELGQALDSRRARYYGG